jgi:hypothetical protein
VAAAASAVKPVVLLVVAAAIAGCGGGGDGDERPSREEARRCLERLALHVTPWERPPNDDDGPYARLDANDLLRGRVRVEAAYYDNEQEAERLEPASRRAARQIDGVIERHGSLILLWVYGHEHPVAERARGCLL